MTLQEASSIDLPKLARAIRKRQRCQLPGCGMRKSDGSDFCWECRNLVREQERSDEDREEMQRLGA